MNSLSAKLKSLQERFGGIGDFGFIFGLFGAVLLLVVPVHKDILSVLLVISIAISLLILVTVIYVKDPPEFSVFPTLLLSVTLYRLGLNVASTRLILLDGDAGSVIESFGTFVVGGNYVVGTVIFLILVIINFVVITKGAGRIAEVTARFTLDAMPGKQMSIDAEMNSGVITEAEALSKRAKIQKDADFYGSMDGASKFVRGDAVAGIFITVVNIIGGILIGYFQKDMTISGSMEKYTILSIGDGLVSQIPAIIISIAAGILVTRSSEESDLGEFVGKQLTIYPRAIAISGAMLLLFALFLDETFWPFFILSMACFGAARHFSKKSLLEDGELEELGQVGAPSAGAAQSSSAANAPAAVNAEEGGEGKLSPDGKCN
jgi:flagellar biosynthesis protein FlhA